MAVLICKCIKNAKFHYIWKKVFKAFDQDSDGCISEREWIEGLSIFLRGTFKEKINCNAFCVYDLNGDGYYLQRRNVPVSQKYCQQGISQNEDDQDENVKELVDQTLKKLDKDHDNRVSQQDYEDAVKDDPLLLECFGPCLPTREFLALAFSIKLQPELE
ncbi:hypothetical protein KUTeg_008476, partial [Tegillarca granosa]